MGGYIVQNRILSSCSGCRPGRSFSGESRCEGAADQGLGYRGKPDGIPVLDRQFPAAPEQRGKPAPVNHTRCRVVRLLKKLAFSPCFIFISPVPAARAARKDGTRRCRPFRRFRRGGA